MRTALKNNLSSSLDFYNNQNLFSYWISSSHNTYLPYGQIFDPSSVCYYRLQSAMYFGGCFEIDTDSISIEKDDIIVTHLPSNSKKIKLSTILQIITQSINHKIKNNIVSGPIILTFDNKNLTKKSEHNIFWDVFNKEIISNYPNFIYFIGSDFDISLIPISKLNNKILLRWGENTKCNNNTNPNISIGKDLCPPTTNIFSKISINCFYKKFIC